MQALAQLINYLFDAYIFLLLLRFVLQKLQASWYNPVVKFIVVFTNPVVKLTRRFIPGVKGYDLAIVAVAFVLELVELYLIYWMRLGFTLHINGVLLMALMALLTKLVYVFLFSIIVWAFLSWFTTAQRNPMAEVTGVIAYSPLQAIRRIVPSISGIDVSPMIAILVFYLIMAFILTPLLQLGLRMAVS